LIAIAISIAAQQVESDAVNCRLVRPYPFGQTAATLLLSGQGDNVRLFFIVIRSATRTLGIAWFEFFNHIRAR
jgi:hypothetical protein